MKKNLPLLTLVLLFTAATSFAQDNAGQYMDAIGKQQENVSKKYLIYTSASAHGKREKKVEALRAKLMDEIQESRENISGMGSFNGDKSYRDTAVNFMKFYYNVMNDDYSKIINMEEIAEQSYDDMSAYLLTEEKVEQKLAESNASMQAAQKSFAAKNNIIITEDKSELGGMMKEVGELNKYYHRVYLVFFKPFIQEKHMLEAMGKTNLTGMEQSKNAMLKYAQEGLVELASIQSYKGDNSLAGACKQMLNFYVKEADKSTVLNDYFLSKERFEKMKADMDKKGDRTKDDVNAYNKAVNEINKASQTYNNTIKEENDRRNEDFNNWNSAIKTYFDEHTPHYK